jgi:hypothetical protein
MVEKFRRTIEIRQLRSIVDQDKKVLILIRHSKLDNGPKTISLYCPFNGHVQTVQSVQRGSKTSQVKY